MPPIIIHIIPAIIAKHATVGYEQPLIGKPGLGAPGCMYLTSLVPTFGGLFRRR
jgi:hypothetical protein